MPLVRWPPIDFSARPECGIRDRTPSPGRKVGAMCGGGRQRAECNTLNALSAWGCVGFCSNLLHVCNTASPCRQRINGKNTSKLAEKCNRTSSAEVCNVINGQQAKLFRLPKDFLVRRLASNQNDSLHFAVSSLHNRQQLPCTQQLDSPRYSP